jgi:pimeloyl-ACP methyl ester carboxylesterase
MERMTDTLVFEPAGRAIPYADEGAGPAVVLMADRGLDTAYLGTLAHMLTEADHRVLRVGTRRPSHAPATMHDLAQDVMDVLDHVGLEHAWIGGHGFGGSVARTVSLDHADRVDGVLLLGVEASPASGAPAATPADAPARLDPEVASLQWAAQATTPVEEWTALAPLIPVLVIQGDADPAAPAAGGEALQTSAPDRVSLVTVPGGGPLFPATHAGPTAWAIEDYLDWD